LKSDPFQISKETMNSLGTGGLGVGSSRVYDCISAELFRTEPLGDGRVQLHNWRNIILFLFVNKGFIFS